MEFIPAWNLEVILAVPPYETAESSLAGAHQKYVQRVHKLLNTVRRLIQLGSFLIIGHWELTSRCATRPARSITGVTRFTDT